MKLTLYLAAIAVGSAAPLCSQQVGGNTSRTWPGQRVIMLRGFGAVHTARDSTRERTFVGINIVMPVSRVEGRHVWVVSTSGSDSGWVPIEHARLLYGSLAYFDSLLTRNPNSWDSFLRRAEAEHALNLRDDATMDYSRAIKLRPREAFLYLRRGRHYSTLKDCRRALEDFDTAIRLAPTSARQGYNLRAELYSLESGVYVGCPDSSVRNRDLGLTLAKRAVALDHSRATLLTILAAAYANAGDYQKAAQVQREALARADFPPGYQGENEKQLAEYLTACRAHAAESGESRDSVCK
jgi:hypothetical protein